MAKVEKSIVVIIGETASGKSQAALDVAKKFNGEIISADSWTVYKDFNIGTAKPSSSDRKSVKHHLLDVAVPELGYSAVLFKSQASDAIKDIRSRDKLPIVVGGTGLYVDSLLYDYGFLPASGLDRREIYEEMSVQELRQLIADLSYDTSGIDLNNKRRMIRLIENKGKRPKPGPLRKDALVFGMTIDRSELEKRVRARVDWMIESGLEQEVRQLVDKYGWEIEPMKGIGYREFREYLDGLISIDEVRDRITKNTLNLAKKQRTWFKRNKSIHWVYNSDQIVDILTTNLNKL